MLFKASIVIFTTLLGALFASLFMDKFGRKAICIFRCFIHIISWIVMSLSKSLEVVYVARLLAGFSSGLAVASQVYVSEITNPQIRSMMLCCNAVFLSLGILITNSLHAILDWRNISNFFIVMHVCILPLLFTIPESPYWIMCFKNVESNEQDKEVRKVLARLNKSQHVS